MLTKKLCIPLYDHFNAIRGEQDKRIDQALLSSKDAVEKAYEANERRLNLLNEFRAQSADEAKKYALKESVDGLQIQVSRLYGGVLVVGIIGVANLVKLFFAHANP